MTVFHFVPWGTLGTCTTQKTRTVMTCLTHKVYIWLMLFIRLSPLKVKGLLKIRNDQYKKTIHFCAILLVICLVLWLQHNKIGLEKSNIFRSLYSTIIMCVVLSWSRVCEIKSWFLKCCCLISWIYKFKIRKTRRDLIWVTGWYAKIAA